MEKEKGEIESDWVKEKIKEYWDLTKEHAFFKDDEEEKAWRNFLYEEFGVEKLKILDVGTGNGSLALLLSEIGHDVVGIDISDGMLSVARTKAEERGVNPDLRIGDAESLEFEDESFDAVVSRIVLWTLPHPERAIAEWKRVLKPDGMVYTFEIDSSGRRRPGWIKRNLGLFLITLSERKNAWKRSNYSKEVNEKLPLGFEKPSSTIINKVELFRKGGFEDVSVFAMEEVSEISRKNREDVSLGYKLARGDIGNHAWYYIRGCKPEQVMI
ncbi:MAG: SAM-dependent methlyltransferase [Candidatus Syntrophoarchaeum caldarius]|uniref:SAM-dependent methlyltransferase n=1 Tax=Candidatus Syntropharchaeum caldarium TaxID=1838285 RepID=A0A1F2PB59_9EURY|nr:MAG: SAM-dependent methlyltransferase [Candidatus Syntrophoarchaeum caldarius]